MVNDLLNLSGLHYGQLVAVLSAFLAGGLVKGVVGFGMPLTVIGILATILPAKFALGVNVLPVMVLNIRQTGGIKQSIATFGKTWMLFAGMVCGIAVGSFLQTVINDSGLKVAVGVVTLIFCLVESIGIGWRIPDRRARELGLAFGGFAGLLYALTTIAGPPLIIYLIARQVQPRELRYSLGLLFLLSGILLTLSMVQLGIINQQTALVSGLALVPAVIGMTIGRRFARGLDSELIRKLIILVLAIVGARLVYLAI